MTKPKHAKQGASDTLRSTKKKAKNGVFKVRAKNAKVGGALYLVVASEALDLIIAGEALDPARRCGPRLIPIAAGTLAGVDLPPEGLISYLKMMMAMASGHAYLGDSDWDQKRSRPFSDSLRHIFNSNLFISVPFISWCLASVSGC
ncbi:hypothetical protein QYF36_011090 [Acer negundo]|nr:hypothetical protein QYF36_011090 [Acer negundo]